MKDLLPGIEPPHSSIWHFTNTPNQKLGARGEVPRRLKRDTRFAVGARDEYLGRVEKGRDERALYPKFGVMYVIGLKQYPS